MHSLLYEINTRSWIRKQGYKSISDVPTQFWIQLKDLGVDFVWLMGIWETSPASIPKYCFHPDLQKAFSEVSVNWTPGDIQGSPYAIEDYVISPHLGTQSDLLILKQQMNHCGLKLILDFVPNHFNAESRLLDLVPEVFIEVDEEFAGKKPNNYFQRGNRFFAHGKDPYFPAWTDTVQVNYAHPRAHSFMRDKLLQVSQYCDGVRCDMAMLVLPDLFQKTWQGHIQEQFIDFWGPAIAEVKQANSAFIFIAEAYWNTQWRLQQLGFDFTYDKEVLDLILGNRTEDLLKYLHAYMDYQSKSVRFIENHDEARSLTSLGYQKAKVSALLLNTIPGMKLHYDGQWEGERKKYPVQMGSHYPAPQCACELRSLIEPEFEINTDHVPCLCIKYFYHQLLKITKDPIFKKGQWDLIETTHSEGMIAYTWTYQDQRLLICLNMSDRLQQAQIIMDFQYPNHWLDRLNLIHKPTYVEQIDGRVLISLPPFKGCILEPKYQK